MVENANNAGPAVDTSGVVNDIAAPSVDTSQGFPVSGTQQTVDEFNKGPVDLSRAPVDATKPVEGTEQASEDIGAVNERLKQVNARNAKLMAAVGLDPLSDMAEQLESGVITEEMIRRHVMGPTASAPTMPGVAAQPGVENPVVVAQANFDTAKAKYDGEAATGEISLDTNTAYMGAIQGLNDAKIANVTRQLADSTQARESDLMARQASENVNAVLVGARKAPEYAQMDTGLQGTFDTVNLAVTGVIADQEATKMGLDPSTLTPQQYAYFQTKAEVELGKLAQFYQTKGQNEVRAGLSPGASPNNTFIPNPAGPGGDAVAPQNQYAGVNRTNHTDAARQFMAHNKGVV